MKKRALAAVLAVTLMVGAAAFVRVERAAGELANRSEGPLVVAHRAGAALGPENTLEALEASIQAGADMAEVDVRLTRDGVPVLLHDESLLRTAGADRAIEDTDLAQLEELEEETGHEIPTLEELFQAAGGRIILMLDLKPGDREALLAQETARLVKKYCVPDENGQRLMRQAYERLNLSARAYNRVMKVARTIADLSGGGDITYEHIAEAIQYRTVDKKYWGE